MSLHSKVNVITKKVFIMSSQDFLSQVRSCMDSASEPKKKSSKASNVTFNMRVNDSLRNDFHKLCDENNTDMSREVKRFMRSAVAAQKL